MDVRVGFSPSGRSVRVAPGTTLLEATRRAGLPLASACGADGICARCDVLVVEGAEDLVPESARERAIKERQRVDPRHRLACRVAVSRDVTVTTRYW